MNFPRILKQHPIGAFSIVSLAILAILFFHGPTQALLAIDAPLWGTKIHHTIILHGHWNFWAGNAWLGSPGSEIFPSINLPILALFPPPYGTTFLFVTGYFLSGLAMFFLLRNLNLSTIACVFGGLAMLLTNTVLTLTYPGHINKVYTYPWLIFASIFYLQALDKPSWRKWAFTGAFLGMGVLSGEIQVAYYMGLWFVAWATLTPFFKNSQGNLLHNLLRSGIDLGWVVLFTVIIGFQAFNFFHEHLASQTLALGVDNPAARWIFSTQYYFPPEEILSYLTTIQFFGGPLAYWGRDGSPTPLRLSDDYMGLLPLGFAIVGGITCWRIWQARLFIVTGVVSLLISFGREGGLFWLLYQLPTMKSQRNPHRWSYFVAFATCVLAAYGVHWFINTLSSKENETTEDLSHASPPKNQRPKPETFPWILGQRLLLAAVIVGIALFISTAILLQIPQTIAEIFYDSQALASSQGPLFLERTQMILHSLMRTGIFLALSAGVVEWVIAENRSPKAVSHLWRSYLPWIAVLLVLVLDLGINAKSYIHFYSWRDYFYKNALVNFLRQDTDLYRVKAFGVQQHPLLNQLVSDILPFHQIPVVDPPAASSIPKDYLALFDAMQRYYVHLDRNLDFFNVKYVLSTSPFPKDSKDFQFLALWNGIYLYKRENFLPRTWLASSVKVVNGGENAVLFETLHPALNLRATVILEEEPIHTLSHIQDQRLPRTAQITHYENNRIQIETSAEIPTLLVMSEKWDPYWKAWLDGQPTKIYKANFLMRAIEIPAGHHQALFEYHPPSFGFWISTVSVGFFLLYGIGYAIWHWRHRKKSR